jgi:uncharacterized protein involved in exopolysaccharide biosynthesis
MDMRTQVAPQTFADDAELGFEDLAAIVRRWKWVIVAVVATTTLATALASFLLPKKYEAIVVISPVSGQSNAGMLSGLNSMVSQMSGLASLAGITPAGDSTKAESLATLDSEALTEKYIEQNNLLQILYADKWDAERKRWIPTDPREIPTLWQANQFFKKKVRKITSDSKSGLVTMTITWRNPAQAAKWANDLVKMTNDWRRDKAITESERNIAYLTTEAAKTDVIGVRQAVFSVLQTEISKMMLAKGSEEYALKVIDPAVPPEKPSSPRPIIWIPTAFGASLGLCLLAAFLRAASGGRRD